MEVINIETKETILIRQKCKHVYTVDISSIPAKDLVCLSVIRNDPLLWHKRLGNISHG